jgi:5-formyltetrahydrofolate cyclo-ligase
MPIRTEINPLPAMQAFVGPVSIPVIVAADTPLKFALWTASTTLVDGPFGASIPETCTYVEPTVLIVPLVGFDRAGNRLGYGGGFYDRSLEQLRAKRPTVAIGFAYSAQELDDLPIEPTDQPLDMIVTERGVLRF